MGYLCGLYHLFLCYGMNLLHFVRIITANCDNHGPCLVASLVVDHTDRILTITRTVRCLQDSRGDADSLQHITAKGYPSCFVKQGSSAACDLPHPEGESVLLGTPAAQEILTSGRMRVDFNGRFYVVRKRRG